jgi:hypothetical protein
MYKIRLSQYEKERKEKIKGKRKYKNNVIRV